MGRILIGHCIVCGKAYKYWKWFGHHFDKEHPEYNKPNPVTGMPLLIRVKEIMDAHNREAEIFLKTPRVGSWLK